MTDETAPTQRFTGRVADYVAARPGYPPEVLALLARHGVAPERFLMVGNALRSDVLPVVEAGGRAVHIPAALSWSHEHADVPPEAHGRYFEITAFEQVLDVIERFK